MSNELELHWIAFNQANPHKQATLPSGYCMRELGFLSLCSLLRFSTFRTMDLPTRTPANQPAAVEFPTLYRRDNEAQAYTRSFYSRQWRGINCGDRFLEYVDRVAVGRITICSSAFYRGGERWSSGLNRLMRFPGGRESLLPPIDTPVALINMRYASV